MVDLWPDNLSPAGVLQAPAAILREQARRLAAKTQNIITAKIEASFLPRLTVREKYGTDEDLFMYDFYLEAPVLDYYRYNLLTILHGINFYPIIINTDSAIKEELTGNILNLTANNKEEFLDILRRIFNSNRTITIINSVLSQAKEIVPPEPT
jgi:hypothetical protein